MVGRSDACDVPTAPLITIPARLRRLVAEAPDAGVRQPGVRVHLGRWGESVVGHAGVLACLPGELDRLSGRAFALRCPGSGEGAVAAFIASQIWGYGANGYGPFRLGRALAYPALPRILQGVRAQVAGGDPVGAFRTLCVTHEIPFIGAAFGSKFLYFVHPHGRALILDRLVRAWLADHVGVRLRGGRDEREYAVWLLLAEQWAHSLGVSPEQLELIIFSDGLGEGSAWTPVNTRDRSPGASEISRASGAHAQLRSGSRVILLGCVKQKRERRAPARHLYISALWRGRRAYAEAGGQEWLILSAKHGLLDPDQIVAPYDVALAVLDAGARR